MYKYIRLDDIETIDKIIGDQPTIKFSSAFNLNDPYELKFNLTIDPYSEKQKVDYFKTHSEKTLADFKAWQEQVTENFVWYTEQEQRNTLAQLITIASFSGNNDNNLMWSHYTDNHKGMCVEYDISLLEFLKEHSGFFVSAKVLYSEFPPTVDNTEDIGEKIKKMMFNKQIEWKYEQEFRVILQSDNNTDYISVDRKFIKSVYIGSKISSDREKRIIENCKKNGIKIFQGITLGDTYKVKFEEHKDGTFHMKTFWK